MYITVVRGSLLEHDQINGPSFHDGVALSAREMKASDGKIMRKADFTAFCYCYRSCLHKKKNKKKTGVRWLMNSVAKNNIRQTGALSLRIGSHNDSDNHNVTYICITKILCYGKLQASI